MTGARLENAGSTRLTYPNMSNFSIDKSLSITATGARDWSVALTSNEILPFDATPDKSPRVFVVIKDVTILITNDAAANGALFGFLNYQTPDGRKHVIGAMNLTALVSTQNNVASYDRTIAPLYSFNARNIDNLGSFTFTAIQTGLGGGTAITLRIVANIGLYGDYAEPDWERLFKMQLHEHSGLPAEIED